MQRIGWRVIPLALVAGLVLTACGQAQPGVAASFDDEALSVAELQEISNAYFDDFPEARGQVDPAELASVTIENYLRVRIVDAMGDAFDVQPSPGELAAYVDENFGGIEEVIPQMSGVGVPSSRRDLALDYLRFVYIENAVRELKRAEMGLGEGQFDELDLAVTALESEFSAAADVAVNPRFGTWNGRTMQSVLEAGSGSISILPTPPGGLEGAPVAPG